MTGLQIIWFALIGLLLAVYMVLDGFDLGAGVWHLLTRGDSERRDVLGAIGPVWDGNEVWLLTGAGAVFAAFPHVYATVFSGMYLALMLVLIALILRAVSIEFRSKVPTPGWRASWDKAFSISSIVVALLLGVAAGNIVRGLPLDQEMNYTGTFFGLLNPYALLAGVTSLVMLACHGAAYLTLKTDGDLAARSRTWAARTSWVYLAVTLLFMVVTAATQKQATANYANHAGLLLVPLCQLLAVLGLCVYLKTGRPGKAFVCSSLSILLLVATLGVGLFPCRVPASNDPGLSLTVANASSSQLTLKIMLIMVCIGLPPVIGYTIWSYRVFGPKAVAQEGY